MAEPIIFTESNSVLKAPEGQEDMVLDLPILHHIIDIGKEGEPFLVAQVVSCWQLTPEEIQEVNNNGGKIYLGALGATHPPVSISAFLHIKE